MVIIHTFYPPARAFTRRFFELSYYNPTTKTYVQGQDDLYFVIGWTVIFTAVRAIAIDWVFVPIARHAGLKKKASIRFAEQGWLLLYYGVFWTLGMVRTHAHQPIRVIITISSLANNLGSISCAPLHTGSTTGICGPIGPHARCPEHSSGIISCN